MADCPEPSARNHSNPINIHSFINLTRKQVKTVGLHWTWSKKKEEKTSSFQLIS